MNKDLFQDKASDWDGREMQRRLSAGIGQAILEHTVLDETLEVMDFGAGTGLISAHIAPRVKAITAVDISAAMLAKLVEKPELQGKATAVCQDILVEPLSTTFDLIVSAMAMHHVKDTPAMVAAFAAHLKPGGHVALADLEQEDGTFHPADVEGVFHNGFERAALQQAMVQAGFEDIAFFAAHVVEKETGRYPVFLMTARKP